MVDRIYENKALDEKIIFRQTKNGIGLYIIPKKGFNFKASALVVDYGSKDLRISASKKSPLGTAHFIEHKLFENEDGDAFSDFVKNKASANAFTDFNKTVYYFYTASSFKDNFRLLLDFTSKPYFNEESVESEKSIIKQEIAMYEDDPYWRSYFMVLKSLYPNSALLDIAGSKESVDQINSKILYDFYNGFYINSNVSIVCCGDIDVNETMEIAESVMFGNGNKKPKTEFEVVGCENYEYNMNLKKPVFCIGAGLNYDLECISQGAKLKFKVLMDIIAGSGSRVYNDLYMERCLSEPIGLDYVSGEGFGLLTFTGEAYNYNQVYKMLTKTITDLKKKGIERDVFELSKKNVLGRFVRGFNSIEAICMAQTDLCLTKSNLISEYEDLTKISRCDIEELLDRYVNTKNMVCCVCK